jgi:hypothetical protein
VKKRKRLTRPGHHGIVNTVLHRETMKGRIKKGLQAVQGKTEKIKK